MNHPKIFIFCGSSRKGHIPPAKTNVSTQLTVLQNHVPNSRRQLYPQYSENWLHKYLHTPFQNVEKSSKLAEEYVPCSISTMQHLRVAL